MCASGHLLERLGLRRAGPGDRGDPQQHAGRGGPEPGRLPPHRAGRRVPSMMAPTVVLRDGEVVLALGSAGSNRIRSAILQTVVRVVEQGMGAAGGGRRPAPALRGRARAGRAGDRRGGASATRSPWRRGRSAGPEINLFFGGVQAVARDPETGSLSGGGDPRRGGAVADRLRASERVSQSSDGGAKCADGEAGDRL